jgi:hypothetical protein
LVSGEVVPKDVASVVVEFEVVDVEVVLEVSEVVGSVASDSEDWDDEFDGEASEDESSGCVEFDNSVEESPD